MKFPARTGTRRHDLAVVLARGASRRMGRPKGLVNLPGTDKPLARIIAGMYRDRAAVVVVTLDHLVRAYDRALAGMAETTVLGCRGGGETAFSVWSGWRGFAQRQRITHVWAHPVDLPLVLPGTLDRLQEQSLVRPKVLVRPEYGGRPGHPVIIPVSWLRELHPDSPELAGPFRDIIAGKMAADPTQQVVMCDCGDLGTVRDFDSPQDLNPGQAKDVDDVQGKRFRP